MKCNYVHRVKCYINNEVVVREGHYLAICFYSNTLSVSRNGDRAVIHRSDTDANIAHVVHLIIVQTCLAFYTEVNANISDSDINSDTRCSCNLSLPHPFPTRESVLIPSYRLKIYFITRKHHTKVFSLWLWQPRLTVTKLSMEPFPSISFKLLTPRNV